MTSSINFPMVPENLEKITSTDIKDKKVSLLLKEMLENIAKNIDINCINILTDSNIRLDVDNNMLDIHMDHHRITLHVWNHFRFGNFDKSGAIPLIPPIFSESTTPHPEIKECFENMQEILKRRMFQHNLYALSAIYANAQPQKKD